jgi:hypothetical protein
MSVPGIGSIISSAMVAAIGTGDAFSKRPSVLTPSGQISKYLESLTIPGGQVCFQSCFTTLVRYNMISYLLLRSKPDQCNR